MLFGSDRRSPKQGLGSKSSAVTKMVYLRLEIASFILLVLAGCAFQAHEEDSGAQAKTAEQQEQKRNATPTFTYRP